MSSAASSAGVPRLEDLCIDTVASHIQQVTSLAGVPEHLVVCLFEVRARRAGVRAGVHVRRRERASGAGAASAATGLGLLNFG